ncbi:unnamed protein product [Cylicostephanus goldi]|uniref:Uncharacterized protein n=1 Tax=Cylicostephanus goldi TaxID=71465 RepID=A0A3P7N0H6_CYLGO|nr:unnamed protein product [Cylicostephanus goldi]
MKPNDHILLFVKGRTVFEFCSLNSIEKKAMAIVFNTTGNEPAPSISSAQSIFLQSYGACATYLPTLYYLGMCCISLGDKENAKKYLTEATSQTAEGCYRGVQADCTNLLKQCK